MRTNGSWSRHGRPHAWVLMRAAEGGVIGLLLALGLWGWAGMRCLRVAWHGGDAAGLAVAIAAFLWASWFGDFLHRWDVAVLVAAAIVLREPGVVGPGPDGLTVLALDRGHRASP